MPRSSATTRQTNPGCSLRPVSVARDLPRVSMDEIAASAALTKRTLYYHFASKDVLSRQSPRSATCSRSGCFPDLWPASRRFLPRTIIDKLFEDLAVWSDQPRWAGFRIYPPCHRACRPPRTPPLGLIARRHKAMLEGHPRRPFGQGRCGRRQKKRARENLAAFPRAQSP